MSTPGTYTVTYSFFGGPTGCPNIATTTVIIDEPADIPVATTTPIVCVDDVNGATISIGTVGNPSVSTTTYQLITNYDPQNHTFTAVGSAVAGNNGVLALQTGQLSSQTVFNVLATNTAMNCTKVLTASVTIDVAQPVTAEITDFDFDNACPNGPFTVHAQPTGNTTMANSTIHWQIISGAGGLSGADTWTPSYTPVQVDEGSYVTLEMTVSNGICSDYVQDFNKYIYPSIPVSIIGNLSYICKGSSTQLVSPAADNNIPLPGPV